MTVLKRTESTSQYPSSVKVIEVDYDSRESLTSALQGQDAVVSALAGAAITKQHKIVDAAIATGVKRFLPSEFGCDLADEKVAALPVFHGKVELVKYLEEKVKTAPLTYTLVRSNLFLDFGLKVGFLLDTSQYKPTIYDGGDKIFSSTSLASVGRAVVGTLEHLEETKNRAVYVEDLHLSQNQVLDIAKKLTPGKTWEPVPVDTTALVATSNERLSKGLLDSETFYPYVIAALFGKPYSSKFQKLDNEILGIKGKTLADVEELLQSILPK